MQDSMMWQCLKTGFCSFKVQTRGQILCKNENNVVGICSRTACPLANSNYATVREHRGVIYLCKKVIERAAFPHKLWEKVPLPDDYELALAKIDEILPYWNSKQLHRCKQRYTKIYQYLQRARKQATKMRSKKLITLPRKMERREKAREKKALIAAKLENNIELEIMNRVKQGVYGERYQFKDKNVFEKALTGEAEDEAEAEILANEPSTSRGTKRKKKEKETQEPIKLSSKYIPDLEDLGDDDLEASDDDFWASEDEAWEREHEKERELTSSSSKKRKKEMLTVEWEQ